MPLVVANLPGVPFTVLASQSAVRDTTVVLDVADAKADPNRLVELGSPLGSVAPHVLTLLPEGSGFGVGIDQQSSLPEVGLISPENGFTSLSALPGIAAANYLEGGVPYQTLNAYAAASSEHAVVWLAKDDSGEKWSLMSWNRTHGTLQELASSTQFESDVSGLQTRMGERPVISTNGRYAVFSVGLPKPVVASAGVGKVLKDFKPVSEPGNSFQRGLFRVPLDEPGVVTYLGADTLAEADPASTRGVFMASANPNGLDVVDVPSSSQEQSGPTSGRPVSSDGLGMEMTPWQITWATQCVKTEAQPCASIPPRAITWSDEKGSEPIMLIQDSKSWNVSALSVSDRYLAVSVYRQDEGQPIAEKANESTWLAIWDLQDPHIVAVIKTSAQAAPDTSGHLIVWGDSPAQNDGREAAKSGTEQHYSAYLFQPEAVNMKDSPIFRILKGSAEFSPKVSDDILAVRMTKADGTPNWSFLQWK